MSGPLWGGSASDDLDDEILERVRLETLVDNAKMRSAVVGFTEREERGLCGFCGSDRCRHHCEMKVAPRTVGRVEPRKEPPAPLVKARKPSKATAARKHGTRYGYSRGCHCSACRAAGAAYAAQLIKTSCDACGDDCYRPRSTVCGARSRQRSHTKGAPVRVLCSSCHDAWIESMRKYESKREKWRQSKRRKRARRKVVSGG